ncbi:MAG: alanine racemase [Phycisphaerales bacterium JB063]
MDDYREPVVVIQIKSRFPMADPVRMEAPASDDLSWLEVDLGRVEANAKTVRGLLDGRLAGPAEAAPTAGRRVKLCPVLKKDAYGLGAVTIAHRLARAGCADLLAVYSPDEAERLVAGAVTTPILVLMPMRSLRRTDSLYRHAVAEKLHLSIHDVQQLDEINAIGQQLGIKIPCHLYVDTGMSRSGLSVAQALRLLASTTAHRYVRIAGIFTHFACSDTDPAFTAKQYDAFTALLDEAGDQLPADCIRHASSSAATLRDTALHFDMARPGIAMLGYADSNNATLLPAMRWCSRIVHTQPYPQGTPVSYGCTHTLQRDSVLGIVPVGHGDGYPVALSNQATVRVNHTDCRVLGTVSMDQIVIDLTDALHDPIAGTEQPPEALMGQLVEVYSNDPAAPHALPNLAKLAGTNAYELLCRLSPTLPRKYLQG